MTSKNTSSTNQWRGSRVLAVACNDLEKYFVKIQPIGGSTDLAVDFDDLEKYLVKSQPIGVVGIYKWGEGNMGETVLNFCSLHF